MTELTTIRGPLDLTGMPWRLVHALETFDLTRKTFAEMGEEYGAAERVAHRPQAGANINRLARGVRRLTPRGLIRIGRDHGPCPVYIGQKMDVFTSLNGLFYWNDGKGEMRRRILLLAWKKGCRP